MSRNILFLPHCLEQSQKEFLKDYVSEMNFDVYEAGGSSKIKEIIETYDFNSLDKVIGVACRDEINLMNNYAEKRNFDKSKIFSIPLDDEGCVNTCVNLEKLLEILE